MAMTPSVAYHPRPERPSGGALEFLQWRADLAPGEPLLLETEIGTSESGLEGPGLADLHGGGCGVGENVCSHLRCTRATHTPPRFQRDRRSGIIETDRSRIALTMSSSRPPWAARSCCHASAKSCSGDRRHATLGATPILPVYLFGNTPVLGKLALATAMRD